MDLKYYLKKFFRIENFGRVIGPELQTICFNFYQSLKKIIYVYVSKNRKAE